MAVAFDAVANGSGYPQNPVTVSHSLGSASGNDRIVLAFVEAIGPAPHVFIQSDYDGVAMTQLTQESVTIFGRETSVTVFYLLESDLPASAGSYDFEFEINAGAYGSFAGIISYTGVNQVAPPFDGSSNSNNPALSGAYSTNITVAAGDGILVDVFGGEPSAGAGTGTPGASQTERVDVGDLDEYFFISDKVFSSSGANSMSWTPSGSYWTAAHVIVELAQAGGGGGGEEESMMFGMNF